MQEEVLVLIWPSRKSVKVLAIAIKMIKKRKMYIIIISLILSYWKVASGI